MIDNSERDIIKIAEIAGVNVDVVRKVLSGDELIDSRLKDRILKIIHNRNYIELKGVRSKKRGNYTHTTIGIILPDINHNFWFEIIKGINDRVISDNYNISIFNLARNQGEFFEYLINERFAGLMIIGADLPPRVIDMMNLTNTKYTFVDINSKFGSSVFIDNKIGGELAAKHLIEKNAKKIAYVGHDEKHRVQDERLEGFKRTLKDSGVTEIIEKYVCLNTDEAYSVTKNLIKNDNVDGIFYFCDTLAYLGLTAIKEENNDIVVVGFDDMVMSELLGLTTIHQPAYEIGRKGADELIRQITTGSTDRLNTVILPEIVKRKT